jgi:hypothetical protein
VFRGVSGAGVFQSLGDGVTCAPLAGQTGLNTLKIRSLAVDASAVTACAGTDGGVAAASG